MHADQAAVLVAARTVLKELAEEHRVQRDFNGGLQLGKTQSATDAITDLLICASVYAEDLHAKAALA